MSENKNPSKPKPKDDLSALFPNREHEEAFHRWARDNTERIKAFNGNADAVKSLLYAISEFWYDRVNEGWQDTIDLVHQQSELLNKMQNAVPEAFKHGEFIALFKERDKLRAYESRIIGGKLRAEQLTNQKNDKHEAIKEKEKELAPKFPPHKLNKEIAKALGMEPDYVRKARKVISKKNSADS